MRRIIEISYLKRRVYGREWGERERERGFTEKQRYKGKSHDAKYGENSQGVKQTVGTGSPNKCIRV